MPPRQKRTSKPAASRRRRSVADPDKKVRARAEYTVSDTAVQLTCKCGAHIECVRQPGQDVGEVLEKLALGWLTMIGGVALCPNCVQVKRLKGDPLVQDLILRIHGTMTDEEKTQQNPPQ